MNAYQTHIRMHYLEQISLKHLRLFDREKTIVLLPVGMLEVHGEHLPFGTDTFGAESLTISAGTWILDRDESLHVLMLPAIPFGIDPVDLRREELFKTSGSVWLSRETFKAVIKDVLGHMIRYGFKYLFPVGFHGGAEQNIALAEICAELRDANPRCVVEEPVGHVLAGAEADVSPGLSTLLGRPLASSELVALNGSIHASMFETSMILHLYPELVDHSYKSLRTIEWHQLYQMEDWPGYVGAGPAHANAELGGAVLRWRGVRAGSLIYKAIQGEKVHELPRHPHWEEDVIKKTYEDLPAREPYVDPNPEMLLKPEDLSELQVETDDTAPVSSAEKTLVSSELETDEFEPQNKVEDNNQDESSE